MVKNISKFLVLAGTSHFVILDGTGGGDNPHVSKLGVVYLSEKADCLRWILAIGVVFDLRSILDLVIRGKMPSFRETGRFST